MRRSHCRGRLYLNGRFVGNIAIHGWDGPWGFGRFSAEPAFAAFAPLYDEWARLMHSPAARDRLTPDVADALRKVECALYAIRATVYIEDFKAWRRIAILNIDGTLIEWKETWSDDLDARSARRDDCAASPAAADRERAEPATH